MKQCKACNKKMTFDEEYIEDKKLNKFCAYTDCKEVYDLMHKAWVNGGVAFLAKEERAQIANSVACAAWKTRTQKN